MQNYFILGSVCYTQDYAIIFNDFFVCYALLYIIILIMFDIWYFNVLTISLITNRKLKNMLGNAKFTSC